MFKCSSNTTLPLSSYLTLAACFAAMPVQADLSANMYSSRLSTSLEERLSEEKKDGNFSGEFVFRSNQLAENVGEVVGNQYWGDLNIDYSAGGGSDLIKNFSFESRVNNEGNALFSVPEAYVKFQWDDSTLTLGRSALEWGYIDAVWGFGKINNRRNFDFFEPGLEGLTGARFEKVSDGMSFSLFGSVLYIPELNPGQVYDKDAGTISCKNPWCRPQSQTAPLNDTSSVPIFYNIEYPEVEDIVFRYSAGARLAMDWGKTALEVFGIRKPENQFSVAAEYYYEVDVGEQGMAFVDVTPQVYYHDVLGANIKLKLTDKILLYGGGLSVTPNTYPDGIDPEIIYTGLKPKKKIEEYLGGGAFYNDGRVKAGLHYIARVSDYDVENDLMVEYPRWNQAVNANISAILTRKLSVAFDHKFDMLTEDRLTMLSASYLVSPAALASLGVNVIGTSNEGESFWSDFSNNDSVYGSLKVKF